MSEKLVSQNSFLKEKTHNAQISILLKKIDRKLEELALKLIDQGCIDRNSFHEFLSKPKTTTVAKKKKYAIDSSAN